MAPRLACIHDLEAEPRRAGRCEVPAAFGDHGGGDIAQHEAAVGIARYEVTAEQPGAAAKLEHARALKRGQEPREPVGDGALQPGMKLIVFRPRAEA